MRLPVLALALVALAVPTVPAAHAQTDTAPPAPPVAAPAPAPEPERPVYTFVGYTNMYERVGKGQRDWTDVALYGGRRFRRGSVAAEVRRVSRFGIADVSAGLDTYADWGGGTYSQQRVVVGPGAKISPRLDASVGVYRAVARVNELGADVRAMVYENDRVALLTASLGRYVGNGFVQAKGTLVPRSDEVGLAGALLARRYGATGDAFVEASVSAGREVLAQPGGAVTFRRTQSVGLRAQQPLGRVVDGSLGLAYTRDPVFPRVAVSWGVRLRR